MKKGKSYFYYYFSIFLLTLGIALFFLPINAYSKSNSVYIIKIKDYSINPITADYIVKSINKAYENNAECLVIELDTPGGLITSTRSIVKSMLSSKVPICVYIYPSGSRAGSAGVFITYASHVAAMAPSTNIGAAHPVNIGGGSRSIWDALRDLIDSASKQEGDNKTQKQQMKNESKEDSDILSGKILSDTIAFAKSIAEKRNRNIEWAEESIRESASITEEEALKKGVVEIIANNEGDLLSKLDGRKIKIDDEVITLNTKNAPVYYLEMNFRQALLNVLANPNIAYILLLLGFYGLLFEVTHPGIGFPGVAGAICLILALFSMQTLPTNYAGLALIFLGVILFIAEVNVPGFGLPTLGGVVCMILGSLILFESPYKIMRVSIMLAVSSSLATAGITIFLVGAVVKSHRRKVISGKEGLIGEIGDARSNIRPDRGGKVHIHGEIWNAASEETIRKGDKVKIIKVEGLNIYVEKVKEGRSP